MSCESSGLALWALVTDHEVCAPLAVFQTMRDTTLAGRDRVMRSSVMTIIADNTPQRKHGTVDDYCVLPVVINNSNH
jgi:hypothetical protein